MSTKIDLFKEHKAEYVARKKPVWVQVARAPYLCVEGVGAPGGEAFQSRVASIMAVAYTLKFNSKAAGSDYAVCKLEGLWYGDGGADLGATPVDDWHWRLLIRLPEFITRDDVAAAARKVAEKQERPDILEVGLESLAEGRSVQMLHIGPYDREMETVAVMRDFAKSEGYLLRGPHHEIYLSDPRRVEPERLKTLLRYSVERAT